MAKQTKPMKSTSAHKKSLVFTKKSIWLSKIGKNMIL